MKKALPYILIGIIVATAAILIFTAKDDDSKKLNERISFRKKDKIPYGAYVAYENLKYIFPGAKISMNKLEPGYWDSLSVNEQGQALIIISPMFQADEYEMKKLISFTEAGNDVFVSSVMLSDDVKNMLKCNVSYLDLFDVFSNEALQEDTLRVSLNRPPFQRSYNYSYPGRRMSGSFYKIDSSTTTVLGTGTGGSPNFIHLKAGKGNFYLHLAPMTFSNYFLLRGKNMSYYEDVMSVISKETRRIVWDEHYLTKRSNRPPNESKGWLRTLLNYPPLKWALLTAIFTLVLYVLMEMRRKQRYIPVITKPRNDSLEFVKTIGRLYYDKGDHYNLCRKMSGYFLEHVRTRYSLPTAELNETFIKNLNFKSGVKEAEIESIVKFIRETEYTAAISDHQLMYFHKQLESFYSKT